MSKKMSKQFLGGIPSDIFRVLFVGQDIFSQMVLEADF